jgi:hypothetical protein
MFWAQEPEINCRWLLDSSRAFYGLCGVFMRSDGHSAADLVNPHAADRGAVGIVPGTA